MPEMPILFCGVDVGTSGGIAFVATDLSFAEAYPMPATRRDLHELFHEYLPRLRMAVVERVRSSPQMGVVSAFTFGTNYERPLAILTCLGVPFEEVAPTVWQKTFGLTLRGKALGASSTKKKHAHRQKAQELFPRLKVTLSTCDAPLIAEFARRCREGR